MPRKNKNKDKDNSAPKRHVPGAEYVDTPATGSRPSIGDGAASSTGNASRPANTGSGSTSNGAASSTGNAPRPASTGPPVVSTTTLADRTVHRPAVAIPAAHSGDVSRQGASTTTTVNSTPAAPSTQSPKKPATATPVASSATASLIGNPSDVTVVNPSKDSTVKHPKTQISVYPGTKLLKLDSSRVDKESKLLVKVNHYPITTLPGVSIHQYKVTIPLKGDEEEPSPVLAKKIWEQLFNSGRGVFGNIAVWDGVSAAWSTRFLQNRDLGQRKIDLIETDPPRTQSFNISVEHVRQLNITELIAHLTRWRGAGVVYHPPEIFDCFRWLMATFRQRLDGRFLSTRKSTTYFDDFSKKGYYRGTGLIEARRGIEQRLCFTFNVLALNIDLKAGLFRAKDRTLVEVALDANDTTNVAHLTQQNCSNPDNLIGAKFVVRHLQGSKNKKKKFVGGISEKSANQHTFKYGGKPTTVTEYFLKAYDIKLAYPDLKLIVVDRRKKGDKEDDGFEELLPMEVCYTVNDERFKGLDVIGNDHMSDFIGFASSDATTRRNAIDSHVGQQPQSNWTTPIIRGFDLAVSQEMLKVPAIHMTAPKPNPIGKDRDGKTDLNASLGYWDMKNKNFSAAMTVTRMVVVIVDRVCSPNAANYLAEQLVIMCQAHGMTMPTAATQIIRYSSTDDTQSLKKQLGDRLDLALIVMDKVPLRYNRIKAAFDEWGISSQCFDRQNSNLRPFESGPIKPAYLGNIALKINVKLGGTNWVLNSISGLYDDTMIMAADVIHPSPREAKKGSSVSVAVLVGTYDANCLKYTAVETVLRPNDKDSKNKKVSKEIIDFEIMKRMFRELLNRYFEKRKALPKRILYLRDGVSDGQIDGVDGLLKQEVEAIKAVRDTSEKLNFKLATVNCIKRHHTRFFPTEWRKDGNVPPGTAVEASLGTNDIFVVSQATIGNKGTCRPTHYVSIYDELDIKIANFERLMLDGCFSYQSATRSVGLHSAVKYADKCATRAKMRLYLDNNNTWQLTPVNPALKFKMYWM